MNEAGVMNVLDTLCYLLHNGCTFVLVELSLPRYILLKRSLHKFEDNVDMFISFKHLDEADDVLVL